MKTPRILPFRLLPPRLSSVQLSPVRLLPVRLPPLCVPAAGLLAILLMAAPCGTAFAQMDSREAIDLQNQIAELRQEIQQMQNAQQTGNQAPPNYAPQPMAPYPGQGSGPTGGNDTVADLVVRISALEETVRDQQGRIDDLTNQLQRTHDDLTKQIGDLEFKLGQGGAPAAPGGDPGQAPAAGAPAGRPATPPPAAPAVPRRTAEMVLKEGNAALARRDFTSAANAAREVLGNARGPRLTDAQFLLARAEGGLGQYKESAADFYKAYQRAPKSPTGQVALLGVANSLIAMNDAHDACQALAKLTTEYPGASAGVKAGVASARKRAGCGR
jgi:TolA-binding protein